MTGAPNIVRGGSHSGNVAAEELAHAGHLDILSSDYAPSSPLMAAFQRPIRAPAITLPEVIRAVPATPADAIGHAHRGCFVCVVGPSGAGKDTLIDIAREELGGDGRFFFVRRFITRPPSGGEDHYPVLEAEFDAMRKAGDFAISWQAHGLSYGAPIDIVGRCAGGEIVVCNLSRSAIPDARRLFQTSVALVTAPSEMLAERIAARGRESAADALARLRRTVGAPAAAAYDLVIENVAAPELGAASLVAFLRGLTVGVRRPS